MMKVKLSNGVELEIENAELEANFVKTVEEAMKPKREKNFVVDTKSNEEYYYIAYNGLVSSHNSVMVKEVENLTAFTNKEFAEKIAFKQLMERKLLQFKDEHDDVVGWNDINKQKWIISYNTRDKKLGINVHYLTNPQGNITFSSIELCEKAIDLFKDDLIKYFNLGL